MFRARNRPFAGFGLAVAFVVAGALSGGAVALAVSDGDSPSTDEAVADHDHESTTTSGRPSATPQQDPQSQTGAQPPLQDQQQNLHQHGAGMSPYAERYADAPDDDQAAADALLAGVRSALAGFADVDAAVAAGYHAPALPRGPMVHYFNREITRAGHVLDPAHPNGLVYYTIDGAAPVLLGAFFVAPPGVIAPTPAEGLVVWHSHDPACASFFATAADPCTGTRRMLHVWTVDEIALVARRTGLPVDVRVTDPFGAPFGKSIERAA